MATCSLKGSYRIHVRFVKFNETATKVLATKFKWMQFNLSIPLKKIVWYNHTKAPFILNKKKHWGEAHLLEIWQMKILINYSNTNTQTPTDKTNLVLFIQIKLNKIIIKEMNKM